MTDERKQDFLNTGLAKFRVAEMHISIDAGDFVGRIGNTRSFLIMGAMEAGRSHYQGLSQKMAKIGNIIYEDLRATKRYDFDVTERGTLITVSPDVTPENIYDDFKSATDKIRLRLASERSAGRNMD